MKPSAKLLRPAIALAHRAKVPKPAALEQDLLFERKRSADKDVQKLESAAKAGIETRIDALLDSLRRDTSGRPTPVPGAVAIRILGATCGDKTLVPLPRLKVTLNAEGGALATALTDVTGLAVLVPRASEAGKEAGKEPSQAEVGPKAAAGSSERDAAAVVYNLRVTASDGSKIADIEGDPTRTHLIHLGDQKALEGHAALGRGWVSALDRAGAQRDKAAKAAKAELTEHLSRARGRLAAIERRLELQRKKA